MVFLGENIQALSTFDDDSRRQHVAGGGKEVDTERAFAIADSLEKGLARELLTNFTRRLPRAKKLWRFQVDRSQDRREYRLSCNGEEFLTFAKVSRCANHVSFFLYDPCEKHGLYDANRPVFTMSCDATRAEWRLVQERHDNTFLSKNWSCGGGGRQEIARIRHVQQRIGNRTRNCMEAYIFPNGYAPDHVAGFPTITNHERQKLVTKWNDEVNGLVFDSKGRQILASMKNFQLVLEERPEHVVCQYMKIGPNSFSLDCMYPLTVIQAFGISLTTLMWE